MASNFSNYFFAFKTTLKRHDEFVYGPNYYTGSAVMSSSNDPWQPIILSEMTTRRFVQYDNYIFSPKAYGQFRDMFYSPPESHVYTGEATGLPSDVSNPPVETSLADGTTYRVSTNQDQYSRISKRYTDGVNTEASVVDYYDELT